MEVIGHRGAQGLAMENTLASLKKALEHRVDAIEVDVHTTADNIVVLSHNAVLNDLRIRTSSFKELKAVYPDLFTLEETFQFLKNKVPMVIDAKPQCAVEPLITAIETAIASGWKAETVVVASRKFSLLHDLHAALPAVPLAVQERYFGWRATSRAHMLETTRLHFPSWTLWFGFIWAMKHGGFDLYAYTINHPAKALKWEKYGLKGVFTDFPDRFEPK